MQKATRTQHASDAKQTTERNAAIHATMMLIIPNAKQQASAMRCESNAQDDTSTTRQCCETNQQTQDSNTSGGEASRKQREATCNPDVGAMQKVTRAQHASGAKQGNERKTAIHATMIRNKANAKQQASAMRCESNAQDNTRTTRQ